MAKKKTANNPFEEKNPVAVFSFNTHDGRLVEEYEEYEEFETDESDIDFDVRIKIRSWVDDCPVVLLGIDRLTVLNHVF